MLHGDVKFLNASELNGGPLSLIIVEVIPCLAKIDFNTSIANSADVSDFMGTTSGNFV